MTEKKQQAEILDVRGPDYELKIYHRNSSDSVPEVYLRIIEGGAWKQIYGSEAEERMNECGVHFGLLDIQANDETAFLPLSDEDLETRHPKIFRDQIEPLRKFLQVMYSKKTFETIFREAISDWGEEYYECLNRDELRKAQFELAKGYFTIAGIMVQLTVLSPFKLASKLWKLIN